jgi:hypothetical protein
MRPKSERVQQPVRGVREESNPANGSLQRHPEGVRHSSPGSRPTGAHPGWTSDATNLPRRGWTKGARTTPMGLTSPCDAPTRRALPPVATPGWSVRPRWGRPRRAFFVSPEVVRRIDVGSQRRSPRASITRTSGYTQSKRGVPGRDASRRSSAFDARQLRPFVRKRYHFRSTWSVTSPRARYFASRASCFNRSTNFSLPISTSSTSFASCSAS